MGNGNVVFVTETLSERWHLSDSDISDQFIVHLLSMCSIPVCYLYCIHSLVFSLEGRAWQEPEPNHVTSMALAHCILGKFLGVVCHCFPQPLDVPTLAARCLHPQWRERS